jgi:hypothetical protein
MTAPRLIRIVPTGPVELPTGEIIEASEAHAVVPFTDEEIDALWDEPHLTLQQKVARRGMVRTVERAIGIGRRLDA